MMKRPNCRAVALNQKLIWSSWPLLLVTIKKLAHYDNCRNCVPTECKPKHWGESFNKATKQRLNIPFVFCLKGTENALKTLFDHWCSGLWRVTAGKSLKHLPRWNKMDLIIMLSHWHKDCLGQLLTCPPAITHTVFQPEAWRLRQNVDPNT